MPQNTDHIVHSSLPSLQYPDITVAEYLVASFTSKDPNAVAFLDPKTGDQLTFAELHQKVQQFTRVLIKLGITKNDVVMFFADNSIEYSIAMFAAIYLGVTFSQIKPANGVYELSEQIKDANGSVLVFGPNQLVVMKKALDSEEYSQSISQLKVLIQLQSELPDELLLNHSITSEKKIFSYAQVMLNGLNEQFTLTGFPYYPVDSLESDHFVICYTSGTTGKPKGAINSNRSFVALLMNLALPSEFSGQKIAIPYPLGHISGTIFVPQALDAGMTVVLFDTADVNPIMEAIDRHRIDQYIFTANAATPLALSDYPTRYDLSCLKLFRYGGAKIAGHLLEIIQQRYSVAMDELYGATEFMGSTKVVNKKATLENFKPGNVGQVLPNVEMKIVDLKSGHALPPKEIGEICFRGTPCFIGYLNNEEATRATIDEDGWYHSGDIGYYDETRCLFTSDRIKELIKYKIWSVIPVEIEDFLLRHPSVWSVCVVGVPHTTDGNLIRAYVQLQEGKLATEQELIDYVQENMGYQKRLRGGVQFIEQMPRTAVGKVDRQYFRSLVKEELLTDQE